MRFTPQPLILKNAIAKSTNLFLNRGKLLLTSPMHFCMCSPWHGECLSFSIHWATPTRARECRFPCLPSCPLPLLPGSTLCRKPLSVCLAWVSYLISVLQWRSVWVHAKSKILPCVTICLLSVSELDLEFFEGSVCIFLCCSQQLWNGGVNM